MSKRQWTAPQQAAIHHGSGALLVSAAAGSGKTAVLVQRALWMMSRQEDPVPADSLLILTFTNAAAEELRGRIGAELEQLAQASPHSTWLRRQRLLLRRAFIGTIDAFCQQLVRENFAALNLAPDIALADNTLTDQLSEAALADVMEEMLADEDFARFAALYGRARSDAAAQQAVLDLYGYVRTLPHPQGQLRRFAAQYGDTAPLEETAWGSQLLAAAGAALDSAARLMAGALALAEGEASLEVYCATLAEDAAAISRLRDAVARGGWDGAAALVSTVPFGRLPAAKNADAEAQEQVKALRAAAKDTLKRLQQSFFVCTGEEYAQDLAQAAPMVVALCRAAALFDERFAAAKQAEKVLDFADFEHLALALLCREDGSRTPMAGTIAARYTAVMVDEYQDTNELQDALYRCLAAQDGGNLFYVGDVKQSIYRFRNANPGIFLEKKLRWAPYSSGQTPAVLTLGHNFRSAPAVIGAVNFLFGKIMSPTLGEIEYGGEERLIAGSTAADSGHAQLCLIEGGAQEEADWIARQISQMLAEDTPVQQNGASRPCRGDDFCVLMRTKKQIPRLMQALRQAGIPCVADLADGLLQTPEVLPLVAALAAIDNPGDDVNLAATLLGPLFRFSPDEVTRLRAAAPRGRLWAALTASEDARCAGFVRSIQFYRALAVQVDAGQLCEELAGRTGYLAAVAAMEDGSARRDNLLRFIRWARDYSATGRGGLAGLVRIATGTGGPQPPSVKTVPGHVSLLTIHKSKGLEFPFCFVADTAHQFNTRSLAGRVQMHSRLGVGLTLRSGDTLYPTLPLLAIRSRAEFEALSEEMRTLYVALTRAKQQLFISCAVKNPAARLQKWALSIHNKKPDPYLLGRAGSLADWVLAGMLCHPASAPLWQAAGLRQPDGLRQDAGDAPVDFTLILREPAGDADAGDEGPQQTTLRPAFRLTAAPDEALAAHIAQGFALQPPRLALRDVPAKRSVSALAKSGAAAVRKRPSFMYASGLTAAEKGTAQHTFMQYANLAAAEKNLEGEIDRLQRQGFIAPALAKAIDRGGVRTFLASPLAQRIRTAQRVLREYDFITAIPAKSLQPQLTGALGEEPVLVQGIADLVLVNGDAAEIVDYKTDRGTTAEEIALRYQGQLALYRQALQKRLGLPITKCTIWAFALNAEVDVE